MAGSGAPARIPNHQHGLVGAWDVKKKSIGKLHPPRKLLFGRKWNDVELTRN
jgi:hypothetical protein